MVIKSKSVFWLLLGLLVITSNLALYRTSYGTSILPEDTNSVVLGSLLDLCIIAPLTILLYQKRFTLKNSILFLSAGCILARFVIPIEHLQPFVAITWIGFAVEAALLILEISILVSLVIFMPKIIRTTKQSKIPTIFAFPKAVDHHVKSYKLVHIICSEGLMIYYSLFSWRKKPSDGLTIYKNSSYIAFQIMIIHAIFIETIGIHWWLHDKSIILSILLLIFNVYSVLFFIGDLQAMRLNPITFSEKTLFISSGLMKRIEIPYDLISDIIIDKDSLMKKSSRDTLEFVLQDFEKVYPNIRITLKEPINAIFYLGIQKKYSAVSIRVDELDKFIYELSSKLDKI
ncbi:beta-carotene 15,15'-monooxygenase [Rummeliibacillus sp. TYF005]|uniref:beta-carotene 15,15'-monooxygenase n=1 Tax=unclassified Rummeliibacillus TaxID=2622809 RepID=UPI000E66BA9F|nr:MULTISPECIES: beta-carotene 15,15'-monooxygenase [unclassified Rummeliibacillus]RIJ63805.1 beta-carotene 15,15'-monooxygenase [Rummeliibacillus sp. POC4]RPJ95586.1 beta-carotene 15,15'-monooxygenase [Rummeliibacillus sp. TYF005]